MTRVKLPLCKYARDDSNGVRITVMCTITNKSCPMIRWCPVHNCPRMNDKFKSSGCNLANREDRFLKSQDRKEGGN